MNLIFYKPPYASYTYFIHDSYEFGIGSAMFASPLLFLGHFRGSPHHTTFSAQAAGRKLFSSSHLL